MTSPFFSVVVPCLNEEHWLPRLLMALERQTDKDFEIIIVDAGSKDRTKENVMALKNRLPPLTWIDGPRGVSFQKNVGSKVAKGEFLLFFDADVQPERRFMELIKAKVIQNKLDMSTVWNRADCHHLFCMFAQRVVSLGMMVAQFIRPGAVGVCIVIRRAFYEKINGFDEKVVDGEDWELTYRASRQGAKFRVFRLPKLYISSRRIEKEGVVRITWWWLKYIYFSLTMGAIKKKVYVYHMGGDEFLGQRPGEFTQTLDRGADPSPKAPSRPR